MSDLRAMRRAIQRGIKILDQAKPGWWRPGKIDLDELDLADCDVCILGQLYNGEPGGYSRGLAELTRLHEEGKLRIPRHGINVYGEVSGSQIGCDFGGWADWDSEELTAAWDAEIRARRRAAKLRVN